MARSLRGLFSTVAALLVGLVAYGADAQSGNFTTFADFLAAYNGTDLTIFTAALNKTGLTNTIASIGGTVFIPTDAAFASFATSLGLANATALLDLSQDVVAALLKFHVTPRKVDMTTPFFFLGLNLTDAATASEMFSELKTLYTPAGSEKTVYLNVTTNITDWKASTVKSVRAAASLVGNVTVPFTAVGNATVAVISQVMAWWYSSIADAISDNSRLDLLALSLKNNGMWSGLYDEKLSRTLFAPADGAVQSVQTDLTIDMRANSTVAKDMLNYMQAYGINTSANFSADTRANYTYTSIFANQTLTAAQTGANNVSVISKGTVARLAYGTIQVGGPTPRSLIHILSYPVVPTVTNIWTLIKDDPNFSVLVGLFVREGKELERLQGRVVDGQTSVNPQAYTLMAPSNAAFAKFANTYNTVVSNITNLIGASSLGFFLRNHIIVGSYNTNNLTAGVQLTTAGLSSKKVGVTTSGSSIVLEGAKSTATLVAPFNTEVAYGWAYVQVIDFPLVPEEVILPTPGSAGAALPSVVVLLAGLVAALVVMI
ncbi:hypothetical protein HYH02_007513 [Chlamydomonas schloesseri]|uniref:FAS1 domain-containing protein n=1 Tax=Chlamydomonas schloesseri TaxID=2026947 RepID=A0A836B4S1_9CHLO|nr:hypothetical protein HYH02_007513 [Chlamydomonas schloesseri]|eukprot:KAG2447590.1 hypothetical protein HYH02_007513 [Chlamydomonas schloesseri]